jgi:hypothetical protein
VPHRARATARMPRVAGARALRATQRTGRGLGGAGIRLNAVAPGAVQTPLLQEVSTTRRGRRSVASRSRSVASAHRSNRRRGGVSARPGRPFCCGAVLYADGGSDADPRRPLLTAPNDGWSHSECTGAAVDRSRLARVDSACAERMLAARGGGRTVDLFEEDQLRPTAAQIAGGRGLVALGPSSTGPEV